MKIDTDIVQKAKQGNSQSFTELYDAVAPSLFKLALYTLGNRQDAEDVVSETFIEAFKGIAKLRDEAAFKPWITRILSVRCKRKIGEYVKQRNVYDVDDFLNIIDDKTDISVSSEDKIAVGNALGTISHEDRQIVMLSALQGYTTKEIAKIMQMPHGTVSSKLYRALKKMRTVLEETQ